MTAESCDTYVYQERRRWYWRCLTCGGADGEAYRRRMDADDAASDHCDESVIRPGATISTPDNPSGLPTGGDA